MADVISEIRYQVGEAWKGEYDPSTEYNVAAVVQDPNGLSVYRSRKSGNVGHSLDSRTWWFCIINMSSIKAASDDINALNNTVSLAETARVGAENLRRNSETNRIMAEDERRRSEDERNTNEKDRLLNEEDRRRNESERTSKETNRIGAENSRTTAETNRAISETLRNNAESNRAAAENSRAAAEAERVRVAAADHQLSHEINTHPMRINTTTGTWERWDTENDEYVDTGVMAMASPFATFDIDMQIGCLIMTYEATYAGPQFSLEQNTGNLILTI